MIGLADIHCHQFGTMAFGGLALWGEARGDPATVLGDCSAAHGPGGMADWIGNVLRTIQCNAGIAAVVGHDTRGHPGYQGWPAWDNLSHQMCHETWLRRAVDGGLRLLVMHAVANEYLCNLHGVVHRPDRTCNDVQNVDLQLAAALDMQRDLDAQAGGPGRGWYRIVTSPDEARTAMSHHQLAVVLGIETDFLFGAQVGPAMTDAKVRQSLDHYADLGVRHLFPLHMADNWYGGAAFQNATEASSTGVANPVINPPGTISAYIMGTEPCSDYSMRGGRRNVAGLTPLGETLVREMIARGIMVDVDHMSAKSRSRTLDLCEERGAPAISGHTGFVSTASRSTSFLDGKGAKSHEGNLTDPEAKRIVDGGGMLSVILQQGDRKAMVDWDGSGRVSNNCGGTAETFANAYRYATRISGGAPVGYGSDFNGWAGVPGPRFGPHACPGGIPDGIGVISGPQTHYPFTSLVTGGQLGRFVTGTRTWDINVDGLAHVGLVPDFVADLQTLGLTADELDPLLHAAEGYVRVWERAANASTEHKSLYLIKTHNTASGSIEVHSASGRIDMAAGEDHASGFSASDADNGVWTMVGSDLWFIKTKNTGSGKIEVHRATAASAYKSVDHFATRFDTADAGNGSWRMVGADLWFIKTRNTGSGRIEVHAATAASGYARGSHAATWFSLADGDNGRWDMVGDDLFFIKTKNTGSGKVEVHSSPLRRGTYVEGGHWATGWGLDLVARGSFSMLGEDLAFVQTAGTNSGRIEFHALSGRFGYQRTSGDLAARYAVGDAANGTWCPRLVRTSYTLRPLQVPEAVYDSNVKPAGLLVQAYDENHDRVDGEVIIDGAVAARTFQAFTYDLAAQGHWGWDDDVDTDPSGHPRTHRRRVWIIDHGEITSGTVRARGFESVTVTFAGKAGVSDH